MQVRSAKCVDSDGNEKTLEECDAVTPRLTTQTCQIDECPHWENGQWNSVSFIITQVSQQNVELIIFLINLVLRKVWYWRKSP